MTEHKMSGNRAATEQPTPASASDPVASSLRSLIRHGFNARHLVNLDRYPPLARLANLEGSEPGDQAEELQRILLHAISTLPKSSREALLVLGGLAPETDGLALGDRRILAAKSAGVAPETFRTHREKRLLQALAQALLVTVSQRDRAGASQRRTADAVLLISASHGDGTDLMRRVLTSWGLKVVDWNIPGSPSQGARYVDRLRDELADASIVIVLLEPRPARENIPMTNDGQQLDAPFEAGVAAGLAQDKLIVVSDGLAPVPPVLSGLPAARVHQDPGGYRTVRVLIEELGCVVLNDHTNEALTHQELGDAALERGRWDEADLHYREALAAFSDLGDERGAARVQYVLGTTAQRLERWDDAEQHSRAALTRFRTLGDGRGEAQANYQLGTTARHTGRWGVAADYLEQARKLFDGLGDRHAVARTSLELGAVAAAQQQFELAEIHYRRASDAFAVSGDNLARARAVFQLGLIQARQNMHDRAALCFQDALGTFSALDNRPAAARCYEQLGLLAQQNSDWEDAELNYQRGLDIYRGLGQRRAVAGMLEHLAKAAATRRDAVPATRYYRGALEIFEELGDHHAAAMMRYRRARSMVHSHGWDEVETEFRLAVEALMASGDKRSATLALRDAKQAASSHGRGQLESLFGSWITDDQKANL
jgi:tetratricopeptide (TPR) repeat protein